MQKNQYSFLLAIFLLISGCQKIEVASVEYIQPPGEEVTITVPVRESDSVMHSYELFPNEIYFGDTIYLVCYDTNISDNMIPGYIDINKVEVSSSSFASLMSDVLHSQYNWIGESLTSMWKDWAPGMRNFIPGEKRSGFKFYLEFPPLEDWDDPFWKEMREKMTSEGVKCVLRMTARYNYCPKESWQEYLETSEYEIFQDILIKPRPANEMAILEQWYNDTPEKLFPKVDRNRKVPRDMDLKSSGRSNIKIGWKKYDPWLFIRVGNRKPSDPNNPTTLDGWRKLEASLVPSTMRDEVRLTRLQLEYYSAKKGKASDNAKQELIEWLKSLPDTQRTVMTTFLVSKMYDFYLTSLRDKNRELMRALYDMLDHGCQEAVCNFESINYRDRTLPPPAGIKVMRSIVEVLEPTAEDLAHGNKELPDGFHLWDVVGTIGPVKQVAQFVELKENENIVILKSRDNLSLNFDFSALSTEDKQYAREQQKKKLAEQETE